jgi:hypothetical protein
MNVLPNGKNSLDETQTGGMRSVRDIRKCGIVTGSKFRDYEYRQLLSVSISPSGFLLVVYDRSFDYKVIKLDKLYKAISDLELENDLRYVDSCYNSHNDSLVVVSGVVICVGGKCINKYKLFFVDVKDEMSLNRSVSISQKCRSLTYHSDKLYLIDQDSVYIYSIDGEFIETLYKEENVWGAFLNIAVSNDCSMIYILHNTNELTTINSSGNRLFKLNIPEIGLSSYWSTERRVCVDDQGNVFILAEDSSRSKLIKIIQVSPNGHKCYGVLFQFDSKISYEKIVFDSDRCALVLVGSKEEKEILVLTLH